MSFAPPTKNQLRFFICLALAVVTLAVYSPVAHHDFINVDDQQYITENAHVKAGLTWNGIAWAFTSGDAANWHPLTWISHMTDCQLFGVNSTEVHLVNVIFHAASAVLLFILLNQLTGAIWRSAFVAAFFAWHPLRVESVAWAAERKDVLSAFFWMLTLLAYVRFVNLSKIQNPKPKVFYALSLFLFACGLMSKPMVVTLPFVLLLLDSWPLERIKNFQFRNVAKLILEKIPFFALAAAASAITYLVQKSGGATWSLNSLPISVRIANALMAYIRYISKLFWPTDLALIYPYRMHWPIFAVVGATLILCILSAIFIWRARRNPYLVVGWFWFLGALVPTIGLVQVGAASMADRYTYLPGVGFFILVVWGINDLLNFQSRKEKIVAFAGGTALAGCLAATSIQLRYWQNSVTLLSHTVAVTQKNYAACNYLGAALENIGQTNAALALYSESVKIAPHFPNAQYNLAMALLRRGDAEKAAEHFAIAVKLVPDDSGLRYYFGQALAASGKLNEAAAQFSEALRLKPDFALAQENLAVILARQNKLDEALPHFAEAARLQPGDAEAHFNYGFALLNNGNYAKAAAQFSEELRLTPNETKAHYRLAQALAQENQFAEAAQQYRTALRLTPDFSDAKKELDKILAGHPELSNSAALDSAK